MLLGDFVTTDEGTGLVHTAIAFGEDDFRLGEQYGITLQNPVRLDGTFDERVTDFAGRFVKEADPDIVEALREQRAAAARRDLRARLPALLALRHAAALLREVELVRRAPPRSATGCSPRTRRSAGTPSTSSTAASASGSRATSTGRSRATATGARRCRSGSATAEDCEERFCAGSIADLRERGGEVPDDLHRPYIDEVVLALRGAAAARCGASPAVIDTWFDSGAMPFAQFHYPFENEELFEERFPADFICEAIDQTRGWFYSLLAESILLFDQTSYRNCVCLGLILDPEGQKMSKSRATSSSPGR